MKQFIRWVYVVSLPWLIAGCKSDSVGPSQGSYVSGIVRDSVGNPAAGAYLNFLYDIAPHSLRKPGSTMPTTTIEFQLPRSGILRISIANYLHVVVRTLPADTVEPGINAVQWDFKDDQGRSLYSDVYFITGMLDDSLLGVRRMLAVVDQHNVTNPAPFATTDWAGRFMIPLSRLPLNEVFTRTDFDGDSIGTFTIGSKQLLYAFTQTRYGLDTVEFSSLRELTITLSHPR